MQVRFVHSIACHLLGQCLLLCFLTCLSVIFCPCMSGSIYSALLPCDDATVCKTFRQPGYTDGMLLLPAAQWRPLQGLVNAKLAF